MLSICWLRVEVLAVVLLLTLSILVVVAVLAVCSPMLVVRHETSLVR
jgi:hypothetical protein